MYQYNPLLESQYNGSANSLMEQIIVLQRIRQIIYIFKDKIPNTTFKVVVNIQNQHCFVLPQSLKKIIPNQFLQQIYLSIAGHINDISEAIVTINNKQLTDINYHYENPENMPLKKEY